MPTREEAMAEAYRRGLMPPQQRAAYEEAQRRGLVKAPTALDRANAFVNQNINPVLMTFNRNALPFMDEAADALQAASNLAQGRAKTPAEAWTQARSASKPQPACVQERCRQPRGDPPQDGRPDPGRGFGQSGPCPGGCRRARGCGGSHSWPSGNPVRRIGCDL
jgi:hypothetical protein